MSLEESIKNIQESLETVKELTETVSDFGEVIDETVDKVDEVQKKVNEIKSNDAKIKHINSKQDILDKKIYLLGEAIEEYQGELDTVKESIPNIEKPLGEHKTQLEQAIIDIKKLEKQKADKKHKHVIQDIEGLPEFLENIKNKPNGPVSVGGFTKGVRGVSVGPGLTVDETNPRNPVINIGGLLKLQNQNFTVDTYSASNQIEEGHRTDGTTIVNTYNGSNLITQSLYTFPDATVITQTISYDGSNRILTSIFS